MNSKQYSLSLVVCGCIAASLFFGIDRISALPERERTDPAVSGGASRLDRYNLMGRVAAKYSSIASYKCRGISQHRSTFDGVEKSYAPILFDLDYTRGGPSFIRWEQDDQKKLFTVSGANAWLDTDGRREHDFSNSRDGLMIIGSAKGGWPLFGITTFVFRDELKLGKKFFLGLNEPITVEEREESGRSYYLLTGTFRNVDAKETYWIDRETYLIAKIERLLIIRTKGDDKEYISEDRTEETYSDIEVKY